MLLLLLQVVSDSLQSYPLKKREDWILEWPGQAVLCGSQNYWTAEMHQAIKEGPQVSSTSCYL